MTRVKICGLTRPADAMAAIDYGADALGFVFERQSARFVGENLEWVGKLPPWPSRVAVFGVVDRPVPRGLFDCVQGAQWDFIGEASPKRIHTVRLRPGQTVDDVSDMSINCAAVLLDAYREGVFGGTGQTVDWELAAEFVQRCPKPVVLAGGLTPENIGEAVRRVRPFAVDVSSGVESRPGEKDIAKLRDFIQAAKSA